jgi:hypothetical protein
MTDEEKVREIIEAIRDQNIPAGSEGFVPNNPDEPSYYYLGDPCLGPRQIHWSFIMLDFETTDGQIWSFYRVVPGEGKVVFGTAELSPVGAIMVKLSPEHLQFPSSFIDMLDQGLHRIRNKNDEDRHFTIEGVRHG